MRTVQWIKRPLTFQGDNELFSAGAEVPENGVRKFAIDLDMFLARDCESGGIVNRAGLSAGRVYPST